MQQHSQFQETFGFRFTTGAILAFIVLLALLLVVGALGSWFTVDQGERTVVLRNGAFVRIAEPGLGFKVPIVDSTHDVSVRTHKAVYDKLSSYSNDLQLAHLRVAVNYRVDPTHVRQIYEQFGTATAAIDRVLTPRVADEVKVVFGQFNAQRAIAERDKLGVQIEAQLRKGVAESGIILESVQLEEIDFSKAFEASIEERMKMEVEVTKFRQQHEREKVQADIKRTQANGEADAIRARAQAEADATKLRGDAEASAIRARAHALQQNAALIELVKAEKWNGALPTTMLPNGSVPMLQLK